MNIRVRPCGAENDIAVHNRYLRWLCFTACTLVLYWPAVAIAQVETEDNRVDSGEPEETAIEIVVSLPDSQRMAMGLAVASKRDEILLDLAVAANVLAFAHQNEAADSAALAQKFLSDRGWLARLVGRYGWVNPHSAVLDPAAWLLLGELQQHELPAMALVYPDKTPLAVLIYQVFQRSNERLAVANLPLLLDSLEAEVVPIWTEFLHRIAVDGVLDAEWKAVEAEWFEKRRNPLFLTVQDDGESGEPDISRHLLTLSQLLLSAVDARPPDARTLMELRHDLYGDIPAMTATEKWQARDILRLASLVDGLHDGRYFEFVRGLLSVTSGLLERSSAIEQTDLLVNWLVDELPAIPAHYAADFAMVDPRLNAALASSYNVLQDLVRPGSVAGIKEPRAVLADAVAQLTMFIPDMGFYFDMPVRAQIVEEINICTSIAASLDERGYPAMTRRQFDACLEKLVQLAEQETRMPELSGSIAGPFRTDSLRRELSVTPEQRINYHIGYLHYRYSTACPQPDDAMPNPLEWAVLATTMAWLAEYSPEFFLTQENETRLVRMRTIGEQLALGLAEQTACFSGENINDPVNRIMADYESALRELEAGIATAEADFRNQKLRQGADIALDQGAVQQTAYRPEDLVIRPCNEQNICEMSGDLAATRALIGLFPDEYLVAEQSGLGRIEICYRNMEWEDRRSELVRPDDENVANYYGYLGFDLVGRYIEADEINDLFGFRFRSPEEEHYLFAQASDEVLQDSCPVEWVGTKIVTPLRVSRAGIVPNRLTYLAASRSLPSRLLQSNWEKGAEWRDWFVTGIGVSSLTVPPAPDISTRLDQHLQSLYQAEQAEIYQRVLLPNARNEQGDDVSLFEEMSQVSIAKALMRMQIMLFYPGSLSNSDPIRMAIAGDAGLLERRTLRRFKEEDVAFASISAIARDRLRNLQGTWAAQPEAVRQEGSMPASMMHALTRINILYRQFFTTLPEPLEEVEMPLADSIPKQGIEPATVEE